MSSLISIYTLTMGGRDTYLLRLLDAIRREQRIYNYNIEWVLGLQGISLSKLDTNLQQAINTCPFKTEVIQYKENIGIAMAMNDIIPRLNGDIIIKMDDDALPQSSNFFQHIQAVYDLQPDMVFSPYPVGLINNSGGPKAQCHEVIYSTITNTWYTLRHVSHVGGFCRISPAKLTKDWVFDKDLIPGASGNEDVQYSAKCRVKGIKMCYLENSLIVEHQESTLGQHRRYTEYFKGRF